MVRYDYGWKNFMMHAKVKSFILIALGFGLLASLPASAQQKGNALPGKAGLQGKWYLEPVLASDTAAGRVPVIIFDVAHGHFSGNTGCNSMRGSFRASDSTITFDERIISTKMMCVGYNEDAFLKNLIRSDGYKIQNGKLILMVEGGEISRWTRKPTKSKKLLRT
jgi:heat shock protein HslJ